MHVRNMTLPFEGHLLKDIREGTADTSHWLKVIGHKCHTQTYHNKSNYVYHKQWFTTCAFDDGKET